jgi:hypothetical protein
VAILRHRLLRWVWRPIALRVVVVVAGRRLVRVGLPLLLGRPLHVMPVLMGPLLVLGSELVGVANVARDERRHRALPRLCLEVLVLQHHHTTSSSSNSGGISNRWQQTDQGGVAHHRGTEQGSGQAYSSNA